MNGGWLSIVFTAEGQFINTAPMYDRTTLVQLVFRASQPRFDGGTSGVSGGARERVLRLFLLPGYARLGQRRGRMERKSIQHSHTIALSCCPVHLHLVVGHRKVNWGILRLPGILGIFADFSRNFYLTIQ